VGRSRGVMSGRMAGPTKRITSTSPSCLLTSLRRADRQRPTPIQEKPRGLMIHDTQTGMPFGIPKGARCVQRFDDSLNSAIHITYRISLRSSSMREPRDPLLKVLFIIMFYVRYYLFVKVRRPTVHRCMKGKGLRQSLMILPQVHLRKPCYDFYFL
jgi:hypothetical protein